MRKSNMNKEFFAALPQAAGAPLPLEDGAKSYDRAKFSAFIEGWRSHSVAR